MAAKKKARIPNREFTNIGGFSIEKLPATCKGCKETTLIQKGVPGMVVSCSNTRCGKEFDLVYWRGVTDPKELQQYVDGAKAEAPSTSYDYETTGLDPYTKNIVGVSFCREDQPGVAIYVPLGHAVGKCMDQEVCKEICAPFVSSHPMNAHNTSFEYAWSYIKWGVEIKIGIDSQIEAFLDDANRAHTYDPRNLKLKGLAKELWDLNVTELRDLVDLKTSNFAYVDIGVAIPYGCQDSDLTTRMKRQWTEKNMNEQPLMHRLEHDLIQCITEMQLRGIMLDGRIIADGATVLDVEIERLERQTFELMGINVAPVGEVWDAPFDLGSPTRVAEQLFIKMRLPYDRTGKPTKLFPAGQPSVGKDALEILRDEHPVMDMYLKYKEAIHMRDNFITKLPTYVNPVTGFIHGSFKSQGAPTSRFAHQGPNMAQIPKKRD